VLQIHNTCSSRDCKLPFDGEPADVVQLIKLQGDPSMSDIELILGDPGVPVSRGLTPSQSYKPSNTPDGPR
jgi:hypothetical protein